MKRLVLGLLFVGLISCGKQAKNIQGGDPGSVNYDYSSISMNPQLSGIQNQLQQMSMRTNVKAWAQNNASSAMFIYSCTYSNQTQNVSWNPNLGPINLNFSFNYNLNAGCTSQVVASYDRTFQTVNDDAITFTNGQTINKKSIIDKIFTPITSVTKSCNGTLEAISSSLRQNTGNVSVIDYVIKESCSSSQVMHVLTFTINLNQPLVAQPISIIKGILNNNVYQSSSALNTVFYP